MGRSIRRRQQQQSDSGARRAARPARTVLILLFFTLVLCFCALRGLSRSTEPHVAVAESTEWQFADVKFPCTIDEVDVINFSLTYFRANYAFKKPLMVRGGAKYWPAQQLWTKSFMKEKFGGAKVTPEADTDKPTTGGEAMDFRTFLESMNSAVPATGGVQKVSLPIQRTARFTSSNAGGIVCLVKILIQRYKVLYCGSALLSLISLTSIS